MTKELTLTGNSEETETETEKYAALMESRGPLVDRLKELKAKLDSNTVKSPEFLEIRKIIQNIRDLDERHMECMKSMHSHTQNAYKDVKLNQKIYSGYYAMNDESTSHLFNKKQ